MTTNIPAHIEAAAKRQQAEWKRHWAQSPIYASQPEIIALLLDQAARCDEEADRLEAAA